MFEHHDGADVKFIQTSKAQEAGHSIDITSDGIAYSYCHNLKSCNNELGQLGRIGSISTPLPITLQHDGNNKHQPSASFAYTGGFPSSGHSAILDSNGALWVTGCDRWQQLGLGSSDGGSSGYTWKGGRLWQVEFQKNEHVVNLLKKLDPSLENSIKGVGPMRWIRDVALGGDHTLILSSNRKDVISFGKGGEGQLGLSSKPWVSSPAKSKVLSSLNPDIAAVCAHRHCSFTLNEKGGVKAQAGKCSFDVKGFQKALELCQKRAVENGLVSIDKLSS